ncbi:MAG: YaiI/YqxD family protein [Mariprofundaceae bacterium]
MGLKIWVDADACPVVIKDILFRAAKRTGLPLILVANSPLRIPSAANISMLQVAAGFDVADNEIVQRLEAGDLVITSDIPLAAEVLEKGAHALSVRGELYTLDNIRARLNMRDFMDTLRASGIDTGGSPALNQQDRQTFANQLDRFLTRQAKENHQQDG